MGLRKLWRALWKKESKAAPLINAPFVGRPVWTPREFLKFAEEGYKKNIIAYRCVEEIARSVASVPIRVVREAEDGSFGDVPTHPLVDLIGRPNPREGRAALLHHLVGDLLIAGNAYVEAVGPSTREAPPTELWLKRPDRMKVIPGATGIAAYEFSIGQGSVRWEVDRISGRSPILHLKTFNPTNDFYGLAPIEAAAINIDQHNEIDAWNVGLLQNAAAPSGVLETADHLDSEQVNRLREQWNERHTAGRNAGRPVVLEKGLSWKALSFSPEQMAIIQNKGVTARFICQAFGVPPFLLGLPEGATFNNVAEARLSMWDQMVLPLLDHVLGELNNWLVPKFGEPGLKLTADHDRVTALEPRRAARWKRIASAEFLTVNEKRQALGFDEIEGGDRLAAPRGGNRADTFGKTI